MQALPQILVVHESASEAENLMKQMHQSGVYPCWQRVDSEADYLSALHSRPDVIISDFALPQFSWTRAIQLLKDKEDDIPFILISEIAGEELAVLAIKMGAFDYLTKDKIGRLATAVNRALERNRLRRECTLAEQAVQEGERKFRALFDSARDAIYMLHNGVFIDCNASGLSMFGRTWDQIVGHTPDEFAPAHQPDGRVSREKAFELVQKAMLGEPQFFEWTSLHASGLEVCSEVSLNRLEFQGNTYLMATARDISDRKQADAKLKQAHNRLQYILDNTQDAIFQTDLKGNFTFASAVIERITGYNLFQILKLNIIHLIAPEYHVLIGLDLAGILAGRIMEFEILHLEGHRIWTEITTTEIQDSSGRLVAIQGLIRDVTKRKRLEQQLLQSQKMDVVGQLAGGIAHDFNNILAAMMMQLGLINRNKDLPLEVRELIMDLKSSASRAGQLTRQLLLFGRRQVMQSQQLNLNQVVRNMSSMLRRIIGEDIQLQINHHEGELAVLADPGMLDQILLNLVVNARDAMSSGGQLTIATAKSEITPPKDWVSYGTAVPYHCCLIVTDTGSGIAPEHLPRIFEPFFTTKEIGKGTGLGLATVFSIVNQHGGFIQVESKLGEGTTFRIFLPTVEPTKSASSSKETSILPVGREAVLLVEDEVRLRVSTCALLKNQGYRVFEAANGREALKVFERHRDSIHLVVTDIVMPGGLSGIELAKKLRKLSPEIPILFTSGYSPEIAGKEILLQPGQSFISKPYTAAYLLESMRRCLEKSEECNILRPASM